MDARESSAQAKQVYEAPKLSLLGQVTDVTQGPGSGVIDTIGGGQGGFGDDGS